jgi:O-antigen ligase
MTISKNILGIRLWYGGVRFSPLAKNPHQVGLAFCYLVFLFTYFLFRKKNYMINLISALLCIFLLVQTQSSTGYMSVALGLGTLFILKTSATSKSKKRKLLILEIVIIILAFLLFYSVILSKISGWISSDPNGDGRLEIFSTIGNTFVKSPLFGLGLGTHAEGGIIEYHNTYLEILAATGLVGTLFFLKYSINILKKCFIDASLFAVVVSLYAYGFAGFAMRRLIYWGILMFVIVIAEQRNIIEKHEDKLKKE